MKITKQLFNVQSIKSEMEAFIRAQFLALGADSNLKGPPKLLNCSMGNGSDRERDLFALN